MAIIDYVERVQGLRGELRLRRFDLVLTGTFLAMLGLTVLLVADPSFSFVVVDRSLDVAITSLATLIAAGLGALAMLRYRESARVSTLLQASAFLTLATLSGLTVIVDQLRLDGRVGLTLGLPEQLPLYVSAVTRTTAAALFLAGGVAALRMQRARPRHVRWLLLTPVLVIVAGTLLIYPVRDLLPPLVDEQGMQQLISDAHTTSPLQGVTMLDYAWVVATTALLLAGAVLYRFTYARQGPVGDGFLSIALVIAAFAELQNAFYPGVYSGLVTAGDAMTMLAFLVLLLGIHAEQRADLRALRVAYAALDRLRVTEAERATLEERARLAREIHDGLAQHLWFAKLKFERLASQVPEEEKPLASEVGQALDAAIVEARQAMVTMRTGVDQDLPLSDMIARAADDFGQRSGLRVEFVSGGGVPNAIPPRQQVELLRVLQETLTNVRKHADATVVRVNVEVVERNLVVTVADNGRGFDPSTARDEGLGLQGMEERARLMGGQLRVTSAPSDGTNVELTLPLIPAAGMPGLGEPGVGGVGAPGPSAGATPPLGTPVVTPAAEAGSITR